MWRCSAHNCASAICFARFAFFGEFCASLSLSRGAYCYNRKLERKFFFENPTLPKILSRPKWAVQKNPHFYFWGAWKKDPSRDAISLFPSICTGLFSPLPLPLNTGSVFSSSFCPLLPFRNAGKEEGGRKKEREGVRRVSPVVFFPGYAK